MNLIQIITAEKDEGTKVAIKKVGIGTSNLMDEVEARKGWIESGYLYWRDLQCIEEREET